MKGAKVMLAKAKMLYKERKNTRALGLCAQCSQHGDPLSTAKSALLNSLTDREVVLEV